MRIQSTKALLAVTAVAALGLPATAAEARHGADDAVTHVRHSGDDDGPRQVRHSSRAARRRAARQRRRHGGDDRRPHLRHGADDGPNHT